MNHQEDIHEMERIIEKEHLYLQKWDALYKEYRAKSQVLNEKEYKKPVTRRWKKGYQRVANDLSKVYLEGIKALDLDLERWLA